MFKISVNWERIYRGCIPQRYVLALMGFLGIVNMFTIRMSLNVAITEMVLEPPPENISHPVFVDPDACPEPEVTTSDNSTNVHLVPEEDRFMWDETVQGLLLSGFFWGYVVTQIPGGLMADKFGGKRTLALGMTISLVATMLSPLAVRLCGWVGMLVARVVAGLGQGFMMPSLNVLLATWVPLEERGRLGALAMSGSNMGTVAGTAISGMLIHFLGSWDSVFYVFGAIAAIWVTFWWFLIYETPADHPYLSSKEKKFLQDKLCHKHGKNTGPIPWASIMTSLPLWGLIIKTVGHDWGFFTMIADLPKYMKSVMKFQIHENGFLSALPYLAMWGCSLIFGWLADWLIKTEKMNVTNVRKLLTTVSSLGPAAGIIGASYAGCDRYLVVSLFTLGMGSMGAFYSGTRVNTLDLSPNYAGTLMAVVNTIGALSGVVTPAVIGVLIPNSSMQEWRLVFWITVVVLIATNFIFVIFASGEVQPWNEPKVRQESKQEAQDQVDQNGGTRLETFRYLPDQ